MVTISEDDYLAHYGIIRRSGRYPWGSGNNVVERSTSFLGFMAEMKAKGMSETEIARSLGMSTTDLRATRTIARNEKKASDIAFAQKLKDKQMSNVAIGARMGIPESTVRAYLSEGASRVKDILTSTVDMLRREVDTKEIIDVGTNVETYLGMSKERFKTALAILEAEGYNIHTLNIQQLGTGLDTKMKVLVPPGVTQKDAWLSRDNIKQISSITPDRGETWSDPFIPPLSLDPDRVKINYAEDGGAEADGVLYIRPGVEDISLGNNKYAQVRVLVGKDKYLKGMAVYKDDLPDGVDILFNSPKSKTVSKMDVLKDVEPDPQLPFGSVTRPLLSPDGKTVVSVMNIVNEQGQWSEWSKTISPQVLSKQPPSLAKEQLNMTLDTRKQDFEDLMSLTNPTIKKKLLLDFADDADSAAVHLKAARLPRQNWHVILPVKSIKEGEVFAPGYRDGERVVLIRYPHAGTFEIPELTVNNKNREARKMIGPDSKDAVGIHSKIAERLSGADFDGDTVLVIPNNNKRVTHTPALAKLKGFDPKTSYPGYEGMSKLTNDRKQKLMGDVSNLITDMTIKKAPVEDVVRAVRHSMVVIDAEKHNLNYKLSAQDNGIAQLKTKYQGGPRAGASTLVSLKKSYTRVPERKERLQQHGGPIDKKTGRKVYEPTNRTFVNKAGQKVLRTQEVYDLAEATDAHDLSSGTTIEKIYADHSNALKSLANRGRLEALNTPPLKYSPSAKKAYAKEVKSLDAKLTRAKMNAPLERQAQVTATTIVAAKRKANPNIGKEALKKVQYKALEEARARLGAGKERIEISAKEWDAIQAGGVSNYKLEEILRHTDTDQVRELARPKTKLLMTSAKTNRAKSMLNQGYTRAEVAEQLGVSLSTLDAATNG